MMGEKGIGEYLAKKAPKQVSPGIRKLTGQYIDDVGRVQPWEAHYDEFGREIARTDFNAGNTVQNIARIHHHTYEYLPNRGGRISIDHIPGIYKP